MKRLSLLLFLLFTFSALLIAQPVNDDCSGLIDLGVPPLCPNDMIYSNVDATPSDIGFGNIPDCFNGGTVQNDVWFAFTTSDTIFDYTILLEGADDNGNSILNPQLALYRGDCEFDGLSELACISADLGEINLELDVLGLTPGIPYFIRINDYSPSATPNWGDFRLCVQELEPVNTIDEGGSTLCAGELSDSGGPDGDYMNNEDYTFTICPSQPSACITFSLEYYNIEATDFGTGDQLIFYDSDTADPNSIISIIGGDDFGGGNGGGGGVCYQVQATSGCMTVQFISDGQVSFEGFLGNWECSTQPCDIDQPITVDPTITDQQIIDFVTTPQTTVTITDINCPQGAYGTFEAGDDTDLGLEKGLLLTSGSVNIAVGPNFLGGDGMDNLVGGDADLDYLSSLSSGELSQDACIVELDVFVTTDQLAFEYVFGSEEYPEFVNQGFNDIFAFLISGPGITGDANMNNQENIAVLPDGNNTTVEINSVNNILNWEYYRDNTNGLSVAYDGLTSDYLGIKKSLTASKTVEPCNTYHLKLAIADRGDGIYDSGVFISELKGTSPNLSVSFNSGIEYFIEDCTTLTDEIIISLNEAQTETTSYNVTFEGLGTATLGVDYLLDIPDVITFAPGETTLSFPITILSDLEIEPIETIIITLSNDFGCGEVQLSTLTVELHDRLVVNIIPNTDTTFVCQDSTIQLGVEGAATYFWTPPALFDDAQSANPVASPTVSQWVHVVGNLGICSAEDSIYLQLIDPVVTIETSDPTTICQGDSVLLNVIDNVNHTGLFWSPDDGSIADINGASVYASPQVTTTYTATVNLSGCTATDTILIDVSPFTFPEITNDTTICENYSVQLASLPIPDATTEYSWTPTAFLDDATSPTPIATPDFTTTYTLTAISGNGACEEMATITVTVIPGNVEILNPDTTFICLGESLDITAETTAGTPNNLEWSSSDMSFSANDVFTITVMPELSTTYYSFYNLGDCSVVDSVFVRVDSLPNLALTANPEQDPYCQGDIIVLTSPIYEPSDFPDIEHLWLTGGPGYESPDSLFSMVLTASDTFLYQRVTINNACIDTAEIQINVQIPPLMSIIPSDTTICNGESVQLLLSYAGEESIQWSANPTDDSMTCDDCFDPMVSPSSSTTYTATSDDTCPSNASATINVISTPVISVIPDLTICDTETATTQLYTGSIEDGVSYTWTSPDDETLMSIGAMLDVLPAMTTTYLLTAENECGPVTAQTTLTVAPTIQGIIPIDTTICSGESIQLLLSYTGEATIQWSADPTDNSMTCDDCLDPTVSPSSMTTYTATNGGVCPSSASATINTISIPVISVIPDLTICDTETEATELYTGSIEDGVSYAWTSPDDETVMSIGAPFEVLPAMTTTYLLTAENECATVTAQTTLTVVEEPALMVSDILLCLGDIGILEAISDLPDGIAETFEWSINGTVIGSESTLSTADLAINTTTDVSLSYTYGENCGTLTQTATIAVVGNEFTVGVTATPDTTFIDGTTVLTAEIIADPPVTGDLTYTWFLGNTELGTTAIPVFTATNIPGDPLKEFVEQIFSVTVTTEDGCVRMASTPVIVISTNVTIPNVFTPNGDGLNDIFKVYHSPGVQVLLLQVFNRWGEMVFESNEDSEWDGMYKNQPAQSDVYLYRAIYIRNGETIEDSGEITLLR